MSRILRRPMFRGGRVESRGSGITTGLAHGGRVNYAGGGTEVLDIQEKISQRIPEKKGLSTSDYLRIASLGADILGAPSEGGGIGGLLATASKPLSKFGTDMASNLEAGQDRRAKQISSLTDSQAAYEVGMEKAQGEIGRKLIAFDAVTEVKRENIRNNKDLNEEEKKTKLSEIDNRYNDDKEFFIIKGGDVSDFYKLATQADVVKAATRAAKKAIKADGIGADDPTYLNKLATYQAQYLATMTKQFGKQFAEGGAVTEDINMMTATPAGITDVNVQETIEPKTQALSYDEIRARLPKEIGDDIVTLLANSYQALGDFAQIRTQTDVDQFNQKYQVQLVLPQEA